jgi:hypothetical protein
MNQTPAGQRLTGLYAQYSRKAKSIIRTNSVLARAAVQLFLDFQPAVSSLLGGKGAPSTIN